MILMTFDTDEEKSKFEKLYDKYKKYIFCICNKYLNDCFEAEDATHVVFIKISKILYKIEETDSVYTKGLIYTISQNTAIDFYRKKKKMPVLMDELPESIDNNLIENQVIGYENYQELLKLLNELPDKYKDVLLLRCLYHFSAKETAVLLSISETNVNARLNRGKNILLAKIHQKGDD